MPKGASPALLAVLDGFKRQALHAARLSFAHPKSGKPVSFEAPLPQDLTRLLAALAKDAGGGVMNDPSLLQFEWNLPPGVRAAFTTRSGGASAGE